MDIINPTAIKQVMEHGIAFIKGEAKIFWIFIDLYICGFFIKLLTLPFVKRNDFTQRNDFT